MSINISDLPKRYQDQLAKELYGSKQPILPTQKARLRQKQGKGMNKLETAFLAYAKLRWPGLRIRYNALSFELANGLRYKPDFTFQMDFAVEVKGTWASRDAFPRLKMAARVFPEMRWFLATKDAGTFKLQEILP